MALVADPRLVTRLREPTPARAWVLDTLEQASASPLHASASLRRAARDARKLRSRERRALFDVVYDLIRHGDALRAIGAVGWAQALDRWLDEPPLDGLPFARRAGCPDAVAADLTQTYADAREAWLSASNGRAPTVLRVNLLRTDRAALRAALAADGITTAPCGAWGLRVEGRANLIGHRCFRAGHFELQDEASQRVAGFVDGAQRHVLDLCAGAGGKSLALAMLGARVDATDVRRAPLDELRRRATRAGASVRVIDRHVTGRYDRVLVDAPCSGSGVWRRHPEYRWRLAEPLPTATQRALLDEAAARCAPDGQVIYATCSALRAENEAIVDGFLAEHPGWERARPDLRTAPHVDGTDGMYAAALRPRAGL